MFSSDCSGALIAEQCQTSVYFTTTLQSVQAPVACMHT